MKNRRLQNGFSLVEVMMAAGILAVGLVMIAGTFPVAIFLTAASVEQTIAPIVADEAFAKIQLYGTTQVTGGIAMDVTTLMPVAGKPVQIDFGQNFNDIRRNTDISFSAAEQIYPSLSNPTEGTYNWSAICRKVNTLNLNDPLVQVTVFVSRKMGNGLTYYQYDRATDSIAANGSWPTPVKITTSAGTGANQRQVSQSFITDGSTIVADQSGNIYRVLDHTNVGGSVEVTLDRNWDVVVDGVNAWVIPSPVSGGRSPCIGVYQRIIKF